MTVPLLHEVSLTEARDLSPLYTEAVRHQRPVVIHRRGDGDGVLAPLDLLRDLLAPYTFHVHYYEEDAEGAAEGAGGGGYTLEVPEFNVAAYGPTRAVARAALLDAVTAFVRHYFGAWERYQHFTDTAAMRFHALRFAAARDAAERATLLFGAPMSDPDPVAR